MPRTTDSTRFHQSINPKVGQLYNADEYEAFRRGDIELIIDERVCEIPSCYFQQNKSWPYVDEKDPMGFVRTWQAAIGSKILFHLLTITPPWTLAIGSEAWVNDTTILHTQRLRSKLDPDSLAGYLCKVQGNYNDLDMIAREAKRCADSAMNWRKRQGSHIGLVNLVSYYLLDIVKHGGLDPNKKTRGFQAKQKAFYNAHLKQPQFVTDRIFSKYPVEDVQGHVYKQPSFAKITDSGHHTEILNNALPYKRGLSFVIAAGLAIRHQILKPEDVPWLEYTTIVNPNCLDLNPDKRKRNA